MPAQTAPASAAATTPSDDVKKLFHLRERRPDPDRGDEPDEVLTLAADVEEAAAEGERDREPREDQRRRENQCLLEVRGARLEASCPGEPDRRVGERHADAVAADGRTS